MMIELNYSDVVKKTEGFLENPEFIGFKEDYLVIQNLVHEWKPSTIFEIGTNTGRGCVMMHNASPSSKITTLDIRECGQLCPVGVTKVVGDSMTYDFSKHYPIECWFIDGEHVYENAYKETTEAIKSKAKYIIYHDADLERVSSGIIDSMRDNGVTDDYDLYHVVNPPHVYSSTGKNVTRVAFAIKKSLS